MKAVQRITVLLLVVLMGCGYVRPVLAEPTVATVTVSGVCRYDMALEVLSMVNEERTQRGLHALEMDQRLMEGAMLRGAEIGLYFGHTRPDGSDCFTVSTLVSAENIAIGYPSSAGIMEGWMDSSGHRANILSDWWSSIGIGCVEVDGILCWVQLFGMGEAAPVHTPVDGEQAFAVTAIPASLQLELHGLSAPVELSVGETRSIPCVWRNKGWTYQWFAADPADLLYTSTDPYVVRVDEQGGLEAVGGGQATVTATLKGAPSVTVSLVITVKGDSLPPLWGDVDQNGRVDASDALLVLQFSTNRIVLTPLQQQAADVDGVPGVTASDTLLILQASSGKFIP